MKTLTFEQILAKNGQRYITGAVHFTDGYFATFFNSSISQILSYIRTSGKDFAYFVTR